MDPREIIQEQSRSIPKLMIWLLLLTGVMFGGFCGFTKWYADDSSVGSAPIFDQVKVGRGNLATTLTTSGTAAARTSTELSFGANGIVETIEVVLGEHVNEDDVLASLNNRDAKDGLIIAQNNLLEAELRLSQLLEVPSESALADAENTIATALSNLALAELNYEKALEPPDYSEISAADATTAQRESEVVSANLRTQSYYADLQVIQRSFCNANQIQSEISIDDAETLWNEIHSTGVSLALDQATFVEGGHSLKLELPRLIGDHEDDGTVIAKKPFSVLNLSGLDHLEFWVRSDATIGSGYFELVIYDDFELIVPIEIFPIPDLEENVWTIVSSPISNLDSWDDVEGVSIRFSSDTAEVPFNQALWLDDVKGVDINPICSSDSLPLSEESIRFLSDTVDASTSANSSVAEIGKNFIKSNNSYVTSLDDRDVATANLVAATTKRTELDDPLSDAESVQLLAAIDSAEAGLTSALRKKDDLLGGASENEIKLQELNVAKARQSVDQAQETLADMVLLAPFSGQIGAVNVSEGAWVTASAAAFSLVNLDSVGVDLTVSESDFIGLSPGDIGMATFDSIPDQPFIIELGNITSVPQITQGIVTYPAQAEFLSMKQSAEVLSEFSSLLPAGNSLLATGSRPGIGLGIDLQALRRCAVETIGRDVSDPRDLTPVEMEEVREECLSGNTTSGERRTSSDDLGATRVKPAIGMNASVTILLEIKENVLIVPAQAVQSDNGRDVVMVMGEDQTGTMEVPVTTGITNGNQTEIISGVEEGQVVLITGGSDISIPVSSSPDRPRNQRGGPR